MNTEGLFALGSSFTRHQSDRFSPQRGLKRKFESLLRFTKEVSSGYPSPPMSTPPSPPGPTVEASSNTSSEPTSSIVATSAILSVPGLPTTRPGFQSAPPPPPPPAPVQYLPPFQSQYPGPPLPPAPAPGLFQLGGVITASPTTTTASAADSASSARSGRKSRGHVASACINCKKAHLSCDVQRPCARCIASGKQETCFDVQHKKRGRPRLREEGEFKVEQMIPISAPQPPPTLAASPTSNRPIASTRHRRTESLRSLRSQTSDSSGQSTVPTPTLPPPSGPSRYTLPPPTYSGANLGPVEVPIAYLDLDLTFIRANNAFQQTMSSGQDVRGRRLDDVAISVDTNSFPSIRNQLREEREAREPSYMPPIVGQTQDPLQGVSDADIDRLAQGFTDRTYIWTPNQPGGAQGRFTARVRLARSNTYFVVVTLPPIRQQIAPQPAALATPFAISSTTATPVYQPYGPGPAYSTAPGYYGMYPSPTGVPAQPQMTPGQPLPPPPPSYSTYQRPPQTMQPYQALPPPVTPLMGTVGPSTGFGPYASPVEQIEAIQPSQGPQQLAQMASAPPLATGTSAAAPTETQPRSSSEDEGDDEQSPKKRRRVGIHDVLQQQ